MVAFALGMGMGIVYKNNEKSIMNYMQKVTNKF
jgi:hypothetical protein